MISISKHFKATLGKISLLAKGPKFCPTKNGNFLQIKSDTKAFTRKLRLMEAFYDTNYTDESLVREKSSYEPKTNDKYLEDIVNKIEQTDPLLTKYKDNLNPAERIALEELKNCEDIVIKKADKGNTLIVMDRDFYRDKLVLHDHLLQPTYKKVGEKEATDVFGKMKSLLTEHKDCLTSKEFKYITDFSWSHSNFYVLPKIHKNQAIIEKVNNTDNIYLEMETPLDLKARPIVAGSNSPTSRLSELLEKILTPLVPHLKSYVKDDIDMLRKLPRKIDPDSDLYSFDVVSLYTSISHDLGVEALSYWCDKLRGYIPARFTKEFILKACRFILTNNFFQFNDEFWHQLVGTAMGTKFAPPYACLTMGYLEETKLYPRLPLMFSPSVCSMIIDFFRRYIDDCFQPWLRSANIDVFLDLLNDLHPDISFTMEKGVKVQGSKRSIFYIKLNFLDITIILHQDGRIETDIFYKDTNTHDYLNYYSSHPKHVKDNIPFTLAKKIHVFCSDSVTEKIRLEELRQHLLRCNYDPTIIDRGFKNAMLQGPAPPNNSKNITFVSTFSPNYNINHITKTAQKALDGCSNERMRDIFNNTKVTLATKQPPNLLRQLSHAKFSSTNDSDKPNGLYKCSNPRCEICRDFIQECTSFITANGFEWTVQGHITCKSRNVLYYLTCLSCNVVTYTGKTKTQTNTRMNNHRSECRSGNTTDKFDLHVHECIKKNKVTSEPFFSVRAFMTVKDSEMLSTYESYLHKRGFDTLNR